MNNKYILIILFVIVALIQINTTTGETIDVDNNVIITKSNTMEIVSGTYGEKGMFWRWWPPGFDEKPEADVLTTVVFDLANNIISEFNGLQYNYGIARHTYNWIINNPSSTPATLRNYVINILTQKKTIVAFIGHTVKDDSDKPLAIYEWDPDRRNYSPTNWLLPSNNNWVFQNKFIERLYPVAIRNRFINKQPSDLPKMAIIIACQSAEKQDDRGGWAWAFRISEDDPYSYWDNRAFIGFTTPIAIDLGNRYIKAADLIKTMIHYMNNGYWSDTAFLFAALDLDYDFEIRYFKEPNTPIPDHEQAMYIGRWFKLDPNYEEKALEAMLTFTKNYMPKTYNIIRNKLPDAIYKDKYLYGLRLRLIWNSILTHLDNTELNLSLSVYAHIYVDNTTVTVLSISVRIGLPGTYYTLENKLHELHDEIYTYGINNSEIWREYVSLNTTLTRWNNEYRKLLSSGYISSYFESDLQGIETYISLINKTLLSYNYTLRRYPYSGIQGFKYSGYYVAVYIPKNATLYIYDPSIQIYRARRANILYSDNGGSGIFFHDTISILIKKNIICSPPSNEITLDEAHRIAKGSLGDGYKLLDVRIVADPVNNIVETQYIFIKEDGSRRVILILHGDGTGESFELYKKSIIDKIVTDYSDELLTILILSAMIIPPLALIYYYIKRRRKK